MIRNKIVLKFISLFLVINLITEILFPCAAYALTGGPSSPEFSTFEPVVTTDMVNVFTGDFTYNLPVLDIPGPDGAGYSLSLSYHSGTSSEQEASWVGHGWTLNPGSINRDTRGFPDDYKNVKVDYYNKTRPNWTASATTDINIEMFSKDLKNSYGSIGRSSSIRFNNNQGYVRSYGFGLNVMGMASLNMNYDANGPTFSGNINPVAILGKFLKKKDESKQEDKTVTGVHKNKEYTAIKSNLVKHNLNKALKRSLKSAGAGIGSSYGLFTYSEAVSATSMTKYYGQSYNWSASLQLNSLAPVGFQKGFAGNFNMQYNHPVSSHDAYGYMYNPSSMGEGIMSDYYVEKGSSYDKRDYFIGIPFNNADNFSVTGEGIGGAFRFYPDKVGYFYPNQVESKTKIRQMGVEFMAGPNVGVGLDFGVGGQKLEVKNWDSNTGVEDFQFSDTHEGHFRFNNDLGGKIEYSGTAEISKANISVASKIPGFKKAKVSNPGNLSSTITNTGFSSAIDYEKTGDQISKIGVVNEQGLRYEYEETVKTRNETTLQVSVEEGATVRDNYLVYQRLHLDENYKVDVSQHEVVMGEVRNTAYANTFLLTRITTPEYIDRNADGKGDASDFGGWTNFYYREAYGSESTDWYRYRSPYTGLRYSKNQLSDLKDDIGSVTTGEKEVKYLKAIETKTHIAFFVTNKTTASALETDFSDIFPNGAPATLNGSGVERRDGIGAMKITGSYDPAAELEGTEGRGTQTLEYLEKIVIFSKARPDKPLKTTYFEYGKSSEGVVQNLPNNVLGRYPQNRLSEQSGKLTLTKVWFEYEGTISAKISPYIFKYEYMDGKEFPGYITIPNGVRGKTLVSRYTDLNRLTERYTKESQNQNYSPHLLDGWGNIQFNGQDQHRKMRPWLYQGHIADTEDDNDFDPACWQLKQVRLPSGGIIMVEYEQKDYSHVQDREVMAMASLISFQEAGETVIPGMTDEKGNPIIKYGNTASYTINCEDLGLHHDPADADYSTKQAELISKIKKHFGSKQTTDGIKNGLNDKVYFKFLYALTSNYAGLDHCKSEYITGYANFIDAVAEGINIKIILGESNSSEGERTQIPRQACYDFVANQRVGKSDEFASNDCTTGFERTYDEQVYQLMQDLIALRSTGVSVNLSEQEIQGNIDAAAKAALRAPIVLSSSLVLQKDLADQSKFRIPAKGSVCKTINKELSYIKLPMFSSKRGGGIRVKRLYMYDAFDQDEEASIYGTEYIYETEDGRSSGIATNEPSSMREENPLIKFLPKKEQSWFSRITAGEDKEQTEGPIGESILPAPSVGHSRVVVKNIHFGKTGQGYSVHEYFTAKDYPYDKMYSTTDLENQGRSFDTGLNGKAVDFSSLSDEKETDYLIIPAGLFNFTTNKVWLSQGFRFIINNMHGQMKKIATYGGEYDPSDASRSYLTSMQEYTYYEPGEKVKLLNPTDNTYYYDIPGKEMDVAIEKKTLKDRTTNISFELDISVSILIPPPVFVTLFPSFDYSEKLISTHATSKIIRYPAIVKSILSYQDGVYSLTEHLAYNPHNGQVVLTRTTDGFDKVKLNEATTLDGSIYSLNIPASWKYPEMGPKYLNPSNTNQLSVGTGSFVSYGELGNPIETSTWKIPNKNVISASINTYGYGGNTNNAIQSKWIDAGSPVLSEANSKWRPFSSYVYKTSVTSANDGGKIYNGGVYDINTMFDWSSELNGSAQTDPNWIKLTTITKYSESGNALEETNALGIYSAAKFGYHETMPVMIAQNADYKSIYFEDFEYTGNSCEGVAHSGVKSFDLTSQPSGLNISLPGISDQFKNQGAIVKVWARSASGVCPSLSPVTTNEEGLKVKLSNGKEIKLEKVAKTGEWTLFEAKIENKEMLLLSDLNFTITYSSLTGNDHLFIDDVRVQPLDAQGVCYVYDTETLKLLAQFDDQHFGLYYQYNSEGKLVRKIIETERGMQTVQETQYNTPKKILRPTQAQ